jgi:mannitol/fructose-specific phosphotransferase system IIA component (Ntr-type)/voltage-gated potassium channel Kch
LTLTVMVFSIAVAAGAYVVFGASMALGAFLAGMVVAQSPVSHQAAADALPLRDAFAVLFFVSVGMLFDPQFLWQQPLLMLAAMTVILIIKPLVALVIVAVLGHSVRTALTVALGLAQIGEFSFILSDMGRKHGLMDDAGHSLLVGGAILSITLNPLLFRGIDPLERWLRSKPKLWSWLNARSERTLAEDNAEEAKRLAESSGRRAIVVGFGPVGRAVDKLLRDAGLATVIIDMNMDTVRELRKSGQTAIFGDASREAILESAGIAAASHLVLTLPEPASRAAVVHLARDLNPQIKILVRARYLREREELEHVGATAAIFEEAEAAVALSKVVLADTGAGRESIERAVRDIRLRLMLDNVSTLRAQSVRNIMIPWLRVRRLTNSAELAEVRRQVSEQHFSRWPVINGDTGQPVGYLLAKDLIGQQEEGTAWTTLVRPCGSVRPDDDVESTLNHFQQENTTLAIVREGGLPVGLVTIEDILEQVIGRIEDEYPHRPRVSLAEVLVTDDALLDLSATTAEEAIREMAARLPADRVSDPDKIAELAVAREREQSTQLGFGIAVPHARCPQLAAPLVLFGRCREGIVFDSHAAERVHLVFFLLTPAEQADVQVTLLSDIAKLARGEGTRQQLREASSPAEILQFLEAGSRG